MASNYEQLVKALRCCISKNPPETCVGCTYSKCNNECAVRRMILDAAAAIEELQQIADHYEQTAKDYWKEACEYKAQLPKRGKWIWDDKRCIYVCSVCGSPKVRENMDRQIIKEQAYCYSCGAKMEVQE